MPGEFMAIDRDQEDKEVLEYQQKNNTTLLESIMNRRLPTLAILAQKYYKPILNMSLNDLYAELKIPTFHAIKIFKSGKKHFNTLLYYCIHNYCRNLVIAACAQHRCTREYEDFRTQMTISLEQLESDIELGELKYPDTLMDKTNVMDNVESNLFVRDIITLFKDDPVKIDIIIKIANGWAITQIAKEYGDENSEKNKILRKFLLDGRRKSTYGNETPLRTTWLKELGYENIDQS